MPPSTAEQGYSTKRHRVGWFCRLPEGEGDHQEGGSVKLLTVVILGGVIVGNDGSCQAPAFLIPLITEWWGAHWVFRRSLCSSAQCSSGVQTFEKLTVPVFVHIHFFQLYVCMYTCKRILWIN